MKLQLLLFCCILKTISSGKLEGYGIGFPPLSSRIVGGAVAADGLAPYQISMQRNGRHFCGGSIISPEWVITAAHCIQSPASSYEVLVGTNDLRKGGQRYKVLKVIAHEDYDNPSFANDVGLVRIDGSIEFSEKVQPIKYSSEFVGEGEKVQATGWGRLSAGGSSPQQLQVIQLSTITNKECRQYHMGTVHESHLCTYTKTGEGVCSGDSGGPLVLNNELVGLANWAVLCARGYPDGFARVSYLYDWIKQKTGV